MTRLGLIICFVSFSVFAEEEPLVNVYNWADYIAPDTIENFEKEYGIKVNYDLYTSTEVVEAKLLAGNTGYDVVLHSTSYSARLIPIGVYRLLDKSKLPLLKNMDPWLMKHMDAYDPGNLYGVPYMWGSTGFAYNVDMVLERMPDAPLDSAAMWFDPDVISKFADCGVSFLDEPLEVTRHALLYLGHDQNSLDPEHLAEVEAMLKSVRPYIKYFSSTKLLLDLPNEEVCIAMSWSGDYAQAQSRADEVGADVRLAYNTPREGSVLFFDGLFIPADAPHPDNAHLFLNYLMRPEVIAEISNYVRYANGNLAARPYLDADLLADPAVYPTEEMLTTMVTGFLYGPKEERKRTRLLMRVKTGL
jgi:putrescine transport system substrate-binding protein